MDKRCHFVDGRPVMMQVWGTGLEWGYEVGGDKYTNFAATRDPLDPRLLGLVERDVRRTVQATENLCPFCHQTSETIEVHGHTQCKHCHNVIVPCCNGEIAE